MRILKLIGAILIVFATPAFAKDGAWILAQKSGDVRVLRSGMQPASLQVRAALSPGDLVATGANGRAMLTRGDDYVVVAPGSRLLLPKDQQAKGFTRLIQQVGTMLYKVKHTGVPHFAVDTPMLAAVVKGTTFTVIVDENRAAVQVTDGVVEVSSITGTARRLVERGMTVYVGRERPDAIIEMKAGEGEMPLSSSGGDDAVRIAGSGEVSVSAITTLTGGLVREAPPVAVAAAPVANAPKPVEIVKATAPIAGDVPAEVVETTPPVLQPVVEPVTAVTAPVIDTVVAPIVDTVTNVTAPVINPVTTTVPTVTAPVIDTVIDVTAPVIDTVTDVTAPVIDAVTEATAPVLDTVTPVTAPVIDTVTPVTAPVIDTVTTVAPTVTAPVVNTVVQPVATILPGLGGLKL